MSERHQHAPKTICCLADHLDTVLAGAEDLTDTRDGNIEPAELLRLELTVITHVLQARQLVQDIGLAHQDLIGHFALFLAGTAVLETKPHSKRFAAPESVTPDYLVGQRLSIGTLVELASCMLDALEERYALYESDETDTAAAQPPPLLASRWWVPGLGMRGCT
jgi:hypothetical protein